MPTSFPLSSPSSDSALHITERKLLSLLHSPLSLRQFHQILTVFLTHSFSHSTSLASAFFHSCVSSPDPLPQLASSLSRQLPNPNSILQSLTQNNLHLSSLLFFSALRPRSSSDTLPFALSLKSCSSLSRPSEGKQLHALLSKSPLSYHPRIANALLHFYAKCHLIQDASRLFREMPQRDLASFASMVSAYFAAGKLGSARTLFDANAEGADVVLWSCMVDGYVKNGRPDDALEIFDEMLISGVSPNSVTMVSVITACSHLGDFQRGKWVHEFIMRNRIEMNTIVCTSLFDMYIKGGFIDEASKLFRGMPNRDVVSWNCLISGYAKNGFAREALETFNEMRDLGLRPNKVTFLGVLSSCAQLGALEKGREINNMVNKMETVFDFSLETAVLDMYAKCGSLVEAIRVFNRMDLRDVIAWSAMINGLAVNGYCQEAFSLFGRMLKEGTEPNEVTFVGLLIACSHRGLVNEGLKYFGSMLGDHGTKPRMEHYSCIVDLLGRAGLVHEAKSFIDSIPCRPSASVWGCLLGACATHKNMEIGKYALQKLRVLEPSNDENFVLLSNIYANASQWKDVERIRSRMKDSGAHRTPGCSWMEMGDEIHEFLVEYKLHVSCDHHLNEVLDSLYKQMVIGL